jgi:outer membrane protein OmpA-like peptidoglycan-associated protein
MMQTAQVGTDGSRILSSPSLEIDLLELFNLTSKSDEERVAWIYDHSTEFGAPGFRKFRFAVGDQFYFDHASLILEVDPETRTPAEPKEPVHGARDSRDASQPEDRVVPSPGSSNANSPPSNASGNTGPVIPPPSPPSDPSAATPIHRAADLDWKFDSETLMFATGSAAIAHSSVLKLGKTGELFKAHLSSIRRIEVIGQTDQQGKAAYNQGLSKRRAAAVRAVLLKNGIPSGVIHASGVGEPKVSSCAPLEKCAKDRIVVIKMDLVDQLTPGEKSDLGLEMNQGLGRIWLPK